MLKMPQINETPEFNQAALFVTRLDSLSGLIDECIKHGDLVGAYRLTERLFVRIDYKARIALDKVLFSKSYGDFLKDVELLLDKIHNMLFGDRKLASMNQGLVDKQIREVGKILFWLEWDMNLIMPERHNIPWDEEIKNDFR